MKVRRGKITAGCRSPESFSTRNPIFSRFLPSHPDSTLIGTPKEYLPLEIMDNSLIMFNYRRGGVVRKHSWDLSLWACPECREAGLLQSFQKEVLP